MERDYIIYKIECKTQLEDGYVYVGSTSNFPHRKWKHKYLCHNETCDHHNYKVYQIIRANGGWDNWEMKPVEELKATKLQAEIKEQYWIDHYKAVLNSKRAVEDAEINRQKQREYWHLHKDELNKKRNIYWHLHKDELNKKQREHRALHRDEINKYQTEYRAVHRDEIKKYNAEYRAVHRDELKKKRNEYRAVHRDEINKKKREKILAAKKDNLIAD